MAFAGSSRVWWDSTQPGRGTENLTDSTLGITAPPEDSSAGITGRYEDKLVICARSGFDVPENETVVDPLTGNRVWNRFVDTRPLSDDEDMRPPYNETSETWEP